MIADFLSGEDTETFKKLSSEYSMHAAITLLLIPQQLQTDVTFRLKEV
jgi:hypothetical protein